MRSNQRDGLARSHARTKLFLTSAAMVLVLASCSGQVASTPSPTAGDGSASPEATDAPEATEAPEVKDLQIHLGVSVESPYAVGMVEFADIVRERTNGALNFEIFPASQLGNDRQALESMRSHTLAGAVQNNMGGYPAWDMTAGPYLFHDRDHLWAVMDGEIGQQWKDAFLEDQNIRVIQPIFFAPRHITSGTVEIRTPADLDGFTIRVPDQPVFLSMFDILGANATPLAFAELYTALQARTVDGQENPLDTMVSSGFQEVQSSVSLTGHSMGTQNFMLDEQVWQELTAEQQAIIEEEAAAMADRIEAVIIENQAEYIQAFEDAGVTVIEPDVDAFREASQPFWDLEMVTDAWGPDLYDEIQALAE